MTDKQIIKPRPICLYEDTCLHLKEKTRLCEDCIHHKNYWSELLEKEQVEKIKSLEQECEELKEDRERWKSNFNGKVSAIEELLKQLDQLNAENEELKKILNENCLYNLTLMTEQRVLLQTLTEIKDYCNKYPQNSIGFKKYILQKINECEVENE